MHYIEQIAGYDYIKSNFSRILSQLNNREKLGKKGINVPTKIIIYGDPNCGKLFMAQALINDSNREFILIERTTDPDELIKFVDTVKPGEKYSVLIKNLEEIDNELVKDFIELCEDNEIDIFAVAVLNSRETSCWPYAGIFEKRVYVHSPEYSDLKAMVEAVISSRNMVFDVNVDDLASLIPSSYSYREIEYIIDEAIIKTRIKGLREVYTSNIVEAFLHHEYDSDSQESYIDPLELERTAFHEAGHAATMELIKPGSVGFISMFASGTNNSDNLGGTYRKTHLDSEEQTAITLLASVAAIDIKFHVPEIGTTSDIERTIRLVRNMVIWDAVSGLDLVPALSDPQYCSNEALFSQELAVHKFISAKLAEAKTLLMENQRFFEAIAEELLKKHYVLASEIELFRKQYL